jgi:hypothetical protein
MSCDKRRYVYDVEDYGGKWSGVAEMMAAGFAIKSIERWQWRRRLEDMRRERS